MESPVSILFFWRRIWQIDTDGCNKGCLIWRHRIVIVRNTSAIRDSKSRSAKKPIEKMLFRKQNTVKIDSLAMPKFEKFTLPQGKTDHPAE
jgi:hypothetical protein